MSYASCENLRQAKARDMRDMAFHKKSGLRIEAQKLPGRHRSRHLLPEADLWPGRCTWRGLHHFETYVWSSVVAYNLALLARLRPT